MGNFDFHDDYMAAWNGCGPAATALSRSGTWYVFDYGMVVSTAPEPADWVALERETGLKLAQASSPYWAHREGFDAGALETAEYWARVLGRPADAEQLEKLEELDAAQWSHLNCATLSVLETLAGEGAQLALLSNMPAGMSERYLDGSPWSGYFAKMFFSGKLGVAKPDRRIFAHVLADLRAAPRDVVFIDDNEPNIDAARALGIRSIHFTPETDLWRELAAAPVRDS
ncbi:putative hydrolase of the HAD superfamily [Arthrobacter sp. UYP6]|uniref:HAD family hydrolase n=1 Tax=Arthrobacter sp. UYP6 TaxID=1756378 RepID=UPI00339AFA99